MVTRKVNFTLMIMSWMWGHTSSPPVLHPRQLAFFSTTLGASAFGYVTVQSYRSTSKSMWRNGHLLPPHVTAPRHYAGRYPLFPNYRIIWPLRSSRASPPRPFHSPIIHAPCFSSAPFENSWTLPLLSLGIFFFLIIKKYDWCDIKLKKFIRRNEKKNYIVVSFLFKK
jgi:hypothetical protein